MAYLFDIDNIEQFYGVSRKKVCTTGAMVI